MRLSAAWALARVGDAASANAMLKLADEAHWERIKATQARSLARGDSGRHGRRNEARMIYSQIRATRTDPGEAYDAIAAEKAFYERLHSLHAAHAPDVAFQEFRRYAVWQCKLYLRRN